MNKKTKKGLIGATAGVLAAFLVSGSVALVISARNRSVGLDANPPKEELDNLDNLGQNSGDKNTHGTTTENAFNSDVIEGNLNNTIANTPVNSEKISELLSGNVEVVLNDNGLMITNTYAFNSSNNTYTLTSVIDFGDFVSQSTTTGSYVLNEQGVILLYQGAGLNAGASITGSTINGGIESVGAIYLDSNNNVVFTTQTEVFEGSSNVVIPTPEVDTETEGDTETEDDNTTDTETEGNDTLTPDDTTPEDDTTIENDTTKSGTTTEGDNPQTTPDSTTPEEEDATDQVVPEEDVEELTL